MSFQSSPYAGLRTQAEASAAAEKQRQQALEAELEAVRRQLDQARSQYGTPGSAAAATTPGTYFGGRSAPMSVMSSYQALSTSMGSGGAAPQAGGGGSGIDAYYCQRLEKLLGDKLDMHNLLSAPGVSIDEAFGAVLAAGGGGDQVPWIVTEDHWSYDLNKSHFHNVLETASKEGHKLNINFLILTSPETDPAVVDQKKDVALYAMTYGTAYVAAISHRLDNTRVLNTLKEASHFDGPSIIIAPKTHDMFSTMHKNHDGKAEEEDPVHYTWDPSKPVGKRLHVAPECKDKVIDKKFLEGEENLSLLLEQLGDNTMESSLESKLHHKMAAEVAEVNRVDENKVVTVLFGSESPGKNGKSVADDLCAKILKAGFHVDGGGAGKVDTLMGLERLASGDPAVRKKVVLIVSTAGVGEFPDGSKGLYKEAFGVKVEKVSGQ
eukprot:SAG22_NODE_93_length_20834_cov_27.179503_3_plen_436_part_00